MPSWLCGVLGEDVEDQRDAVDDVDLEQLLQVALLGGRQLVVEDDDVDVERLGQLAQLLGLALADVGGGVGRVPPLQHRARPGRRRRCRRAARARRGRPPLPRRSRRPRADEQGALADDPEVDLGGGEPAPLAALLIGRWLASCRERHCAAARGRRRRRTRAPPGRRGGPSSPSVDASVAAGHVHGHARRRRGPGGGRRRPPRTRPVPHDSGLARRPAPRPASAAPSGRSTRDELHVGAAREAGVVLEDAGRAASTRHGAGRRRRARGAGCPMPAASPW